MLSTVIFVIFIYKLKEFFMFSTFPYKAIKYQFSSDLPLITLTGIGFQNITDHSYSWHNLHRHDKHCLIQYCISGQGVLTINNSTYTITSGKAFYSTFPAIPITIYPKIPLIGNLFI